MNMQLFCVLIFLKKILQIFSITGVLHYITFDSCVKMFLLHIVTIQNYLIIYLYCTISQSIRIKKWNEHNMYLPFKYSPRFEIHNFDFWIYFRNTSRYADKVDFYGTDRRLHRGIVGTYYDDVIGTFYS